MKRPLLASLVLLAAPAACNITEIPLAASEIAVNVCETDADCGDPRRCAAGACVADETSIEELLVQVTPPGTLPGLGGLTFYHALSKQDLRVKHINLDLDPVARVEGHVETQAEGCKPGIVTNLTIPVDVSFTPSERILGIATSVYTASSVEPSSLDDGYRFTTEIPQGKYDVYIKPRPGQDGCQLPPQLLLEQPVAGNLAIKLPVPIELTVQAYWPDPGSLVGWTVALLDEPTGRVISTQPALDEAPTLDEKRGLWRYAKRVAYFAVEPPETIAKSGSAPKPPPRTWILRLSPPTELQRPSIVGENLTVIEQKAPLPDNVVVMGQTAIRGQAVPVEANLKITATDLVGFDPGILAVYTRTLSVPPDGLFEVALPPGRYHVEATPVGPSANCDESEPTVRSPCLAVATTNWDVGVGPAVQAGRLIEFPTATFVVGTAHLWSGAVPKGATVSVVASPAGVQTGLVNAFLGETQPTPRASGGLVSDGGTFSFSADPGLFDLVVQPDPSTRFGWYVSPLSLLEVMPEVTITVQPPVAYQGTVNVATRTTASITRAPIPNALIRAYADADGDDGGHVIVVAETWADAQGDFELLIPTMRGPEPSFRPE